MNSNVARVCEGGKTTQENRLWSWNSCRVFFFYSGAATIDLFWELIWSLLRPYYRAEESYSISVNSIANIIPIVLPVGGILSSLLFGLVSSIKSSDDPRKRSALLEMAGFSMGLIFSSLIFSGICAGYPIYGSAELGYAHVFALICFILMIIALCGYAMTFVALSASFHERKISKSALHIWNTAGRMIAMKTIYFFPISFDNPRQILIIFGMTNSFVVAFTVISMTSFVIEIRSQTVFSSNAGQPLQFPDQEVKDRRKSLFRSEKNDSNGVPSVM